MGPPQIHVQLGMKMFGSSNFNTTENRPGNKLLTEENHLFIPRSLTVELTVLEDFQGNKLEVYQLRHLVI